MLSDPRLHWGPAEGIWGGDRVDYSDDKPWEMHVSETEWLKDFTEAWMNRFNHLAGR